MTKFLTILKASWIVGQAAGWLLFGCFAVSVSFAGEPFKVEPRPLAVPLPEKIPEQTPEKTPEPETEDDEPESPVDQSGNAETGTRDANRAQDELTHAPADPRPVGYLHTVKRGCDPCDKAGDWWIENCDTFPIKIELVEYETMNDLPKWIRPKGVPLFHYTSEKQPTGWACSNWDPATVVANWTAANPSQAIRLFATRAANGTLDEHFAMFLPVGTKITIEPPMPVKAMIADGTVLEYSRLVGRVGKRDGQPAIELESPMPTVKKWMGVGRIGMTFGAQITGGWYEDKPLPAVMIDTNRGPQRIELKMEPAR